MMLSDVCLSVADIGPKSRTERPRKTKIDTEVTNVTRASDTTFKVKGQGHQATLVSCTGRPTWTYGNGDLSMCVHDVYRVTTCRPGRGHIVAAARLQLVCEPFQRSGFQVLVLLFTVAGSAFIETNKHGSRITVRDDVYPLSCINTQACLLTWPIA